MPASRRLTTPARTRSRQPAGDHRVDAWLRRRTVRRRVVVAHVLLSLVWLGVLITLAAGGLSVGMRHAAAIAAAAGFALWVVGNALVNRARARLRDAEPTPSRGAALAAVEARIALITRSVSAVLLGVAAMGLAIVAIEGGAVGARSGVDIDARLVVAGLATAALCGMVLAQLEAWLLSWYLDDPGAPHGAGSATEPPLPG